MGGVAARVGVQAKTLTVVQGEPERAHLRPLRPETTRLEDSLTGRNKGIGHPA